MAGKRKPENIGRTEKVCPRCGILKPIDAYSTDRRVPDGHQSHCRECTKARQKKWRLDKPEHVKELKRAEYQRRKPKVLEYNTAYARNNREKIRERERRRRATESQNERECRLEKQRLDRARNKETIQTRINAWKRAHPESVRVHCHRRRALQWGATFEAFLTSEIAKRDGWICGICGQPIDRKVKFPDPMYRSIDHVQPLSKGGEHTRANVRITHMICNVRRSNHWEGEVA